MDELGILKEIVKVCYAASKAFNAELKRVRDELTIGQKLYNATLHMMFTRVWIDAQADLWAYQIDNGLPLSTIEEL